MFANTSIKRNSIQGFSLFYFYQFLISSFMNQAKNKENRLSAFYPVARILVVAVVLLNSLAVQAQKTINGQVTDQNGEPLYGVSIVKKGSIEGATTTGANGRYTIQIDGDNTILVFRYIGFEPYQATVKGLSQLNVTMHEQSNQIAEVQVVSTGYQKISRERSTAAFGFVDSTALNRQMHQNLFSSLEGQVAGLRMDINPNTGDMSPILRGVGTFSTEVGTTPLIVVDDMPTTLTLDQINSYNVESVTVLKDAAAASIYGARAANGVIVVTTKQARNNGVHVNVNADWFFTTKPSFSGLNLASTSDIIDYQTDVFNAGVERQGSAANFLSTYKSGYYNPLFQLYLDQANGNISANEVATTIAQWRNNDYYSQFRDYAWRTQMMQRYNVSLSQKAGKSNHFLSFQFEGDKNRLINDHSNTFSLYYKSSYQVNRWLKATAGIDARMSQDYSPENYDYGLQQRYEQIYDANGNKYTSPYVNVDGYSGSAFNGSVVSSYTGVSPYQSFGFNVIDALGEGITKTRNVNLRPFVALEAKFLKFFRYNFSYQYEWTSSKAESYDAADSYLMRMTHNAMIDSDGNSTLPDGGRYYQSQANRNAYTLRNQLNFDRAWNIHNVSAIMGLELRQNKTPRLIEQLMYGYDPQTLTSARMDWNTYNDGVGTSQLSGNTIKLGGLSLSQKETTHRYASFYANASYSLLYRYSLSGSIRWDEADLFGLDIKNQRHPLWSLGASWLISEEKWMKDVSWLDYLKLRATYGVNGNVDQASTTYFVVTKKTQSNPIRSTYLNYDDDDLPNPKLRWEKTATLNLGLDFRLFNNIVNGSLEYYNRHASDLLVRRYMDPTLGAESRVVNNGEMRNRGVELSVNANLIRKRDWTLGLSFTYAHNNNKMLKVDHSASDYASSFITSPQNYFMEGTAYNTLWAYHIDRIENGYPVAQDAEGNDLVTFNEDGTVKDITLTSSLKGTDDLRNMGTLTPKYNGSFGVNARWKDLELNLLLVYSGGNKLRYAVVELNDVAGSQTLADIVNRWSEGSQGVRMYIDMPDANKTYASTFNDWYKYGDINVKSADYVKLRSLSLAYNLPSRWLHAVHLGPTKLTCQMNNLFTWAKAGNHIDPESYGLNSGTRGMSMPKTFAIGLSTSF
ncbi:MAG: SusC/RagA family TonB-linked outer membrane protein [Prevotella sp.]|nr:SusC/RagA family TonB-linked outer membrane protein [Prevotella sp.]